jgi:hypothetical protein
MSVHHGSAESPRQAWARRALVAATCALLVAPAAAEPIDLGDASILSRQGQRLRIAIPFGSSPGDRVSATRFQVVSVEATGGEGTAPDPARFTVAKPERRNVVFLRSDRPVSLESVRIVVSVADPDGSPSAAAYDIEIPPARLAPAAGTPRRR